MLYRYSERLAWTIPVNSFSTLLSELRASGRPLLDLTISNPTQALPDYPHAEIAAALGAIPNLRYQPEPLGLLEARAAIVRRMQQRAPGIELSPSHVALTASTSEAYALLFKLLANPGDEVLVPAPSYPLFDYLAQLEAVTPKPYRLAYDGSWFIDFASLQAAVSTRTRAVILVNPNNPTGSFLKQHEWARLCEFALANSVPLISDEVFTDYAFAPSAERVSTLIGQHRVLSFTLHGLSKSAAMPQMKLAWIAVNGPAAEREQACARLELLLDTYLSVGTPVQLAAEQLLGIGDSIQRRIHARIQNNLAALQSLLHDTPVHMLGAEGGWSAILRVPRILTEEEWITRLLREQSVIVQPGYFFDLHGEAFLVVSLITPEDTFSHGLAKILAFSNTL
jgi:alanine-synthesizing transaminase